MGILKSLWTKEGTSDEVRMTYQHVLDLKEKIAETCKLAAVESNKAVERTKFYYNKHAKHRSFVPGDRVLLLLSTHSSKLLLAWKSPFEVVEKVNDLNYKIKLANKVRLFHANMLKKYEERDEFKQVGENGVEHIVDKPVLELVDTVDVNLAGLAVINESILIDEDITHIELPVLECEEKETYLNIVYSDSLDASKLDQLKRLVYEYRHIFSDIPGRTNIVNVDIVLESDREENIKPYPLPLSLRDELDKQLDSMLQMGIIEPSSAKYSSPVVMVKKPDGSFRCCCDYRAINKLGKLDLEVIPKMELIWARMEGSQYYSKVDLTRGF